MEFHVAGPEGGMILNVAGPEGGMGCTSYGPEGDICYDVVRQRSDSL